MVVNGKLVTPLAYCISTLSSFWPEISEELANFSPMISDLRQMNVSQKSCMRIQFAYNNAER